SDPLALAFISDRRWGQARRALDRSFAGPRGRGGLGWDARSCSRGTSHGEASPWAALRGPCRRGSPELPRRLRGRGKERARAPRVGGVREADRENPEAGAEGCGPASARLEEPRLISSVLSHG